MAIYGTGTFVKNLWIRNPLGEWIPVPFGAGQDSYLRSINVWDGKKWWVPTWGWMEWRRKGSQGSNLPSLEVRRAANHSIQMFANVSSGTSVFKDSRVFPNGDPFNPFFNQWVRLMHMRPRPVADWRIVRIGPVYPLSPPNRVLDWNTGVRQDWRVFPGAMGCMRFAAVNTDAANAVPTPSLGGTAAYIWHGLGGGYFSGINFGSFSEHVEHVEARHDRYSTGDYTQVFECAMIDFEAIRARLISFYREQGLDYIGQYDPIELMDIRRVYVRAQVYAMGVSIVNDRPHEVDAAALKNTTLRVYAASGSPGTPVTGSVPRTFYQQTNEWETVTTRLPASYAPGGTIVYEANTGSLGPQQQVTDNEQSYWNQSNQNTPIYSYTSTRELNVQTFDFVIENPGHDNLALTATITSPPTVPSPSPDLDGHYPEPYVAHSSAWVTVRIQDIGIHWAYPGKDTPTNLHHWNAWG
jgi:hypothetical protein